MVFDVYFWTSALIFGNTAEVDVILAKTVDDILSKERDNILK